MKKWITWQGPFNDSGAYSTINRCITKELELKDWRISRNLHNDSYEIAPILVSCIYPPAPVQMRHRLNIVVSNWEFTGPRGVPASFIDAYNTYDLVVAKSEWTAQNYRTCGAKNVKNMLLGCDLSEFTSQGLMVRRTDYGIPEKAIFMLWVGGTDKRHGFDVAVDVLKRLPDNYWLLAKQSIHYPLASAQHERLVVVRQDFPSLAPLYRAADVLLHTARGVGASMPVFEALACGLPVVSTDLPPVREIAALHPRLAEAMRFTPGTWQSMGVHHLHPDCAPIWLEPDIDALVEQCHRLPAANIPDKVRRTLGWRRAANALERHITDAISSI